MYIRHIYFSYKCTPLEILQKITSFYIIYTRECNQVRFHFPILTMGKKFMILHLSNVCM